MRTRVINLVLLISILGLVGCGKKEPEVVPQVGIQYDKPETEGSEEETETEKETETETEVSEKKGISGNGLAGLADLQKEFNIEDTEKTLSQSITDIPNYLANYIAQYYTKENLVLDVYKVIYDDKMIITKTKEDGNYLLFSLSNYKDTSKAIVKISELDNGKLYIYKDYLVSVKKGLVQGTIYIGEGTPSVRAEDIGAKSVLGSGEKIEF